MDPNCNRLKNKMEINEQSLNSLNQVFVSILSPDNAARRAGEEYLRNLESQQGFSLLLLTLINKLVQSTSPHDISIRQCTAVYLKNLVKRCWEIEEVQ